MEMKSLQMTTWDILRENALQIVMYLIGAVITALIAWPLAVLYAAYSLFSNVLYMA